MVRTLVAPNASAMTLDGTRTHLVGQARVVVIDPGPAIDAHVDAVAERIGDGVVVGVLVTHAHPDHAASAVPMAERFGAPVRARYAGTLADGDRIETDTGAVVAIATPGHVPDHFAFHWPAGAAVFCGDLMMGGLDTALVAAPEGRIADYLDSLERIRALAPRVIHPAHGPPFEDADAAIDDYIRHRRTREEQVLRALRSGPKDLEGLIGAVYGAALVHELRRPAMGSVRAYLEHLSEAGRVRRVKGGWALA